MKKSFEKSYGEMVGEAIEYPRGYYELTNEYHAGLGAWGVRIRAGRLVYVDDDTNVFEYDPVVKSVVPVKTPVEGSNLRFRWNGRDDAELTSPFKKAAKQISKADFEARKAGKSRTLEGVYSPDEAMEVLSTLNRKARVHLRVE